MTIEEALKYNGVRVSNGDKWLVWNIGDWCVYKHEYHARIAQLVISTGNIERALDALIKD